MKIQFSETRDDSMGNNKLQLWYSFDDFTFVESRAISEEAVSMARKLTAEIEKNLREVDSYRR